MPTLDWLNRAAAFTTAAKVPYRLLEQVSVHTSSPGNTTNSIAAQAINTNPRDQNGTQNGLNSDNLLIQGDNLEALKALLPPKERRGLILIDPPFEEAGELGRLAEQSPPGRAAVAQPPRLAARPAQRHDARLQLAGVGAAVRQALCAIGPTRVAV